MIDEPIHESAHLLKEQATVAYLESDGKQEQSLGKLLIQAREKIGLSAGDVAKKLFLMEDKIHSIESDQLHNFDAPIYARGYVESYAKLVDVPASVWEPLLFQLGFNMAPNVSTYATKPVQVDPSIANLGRSVLITQQEKKHKKSLWLSALILIGILIVLIYWSFGAADHHHSLPTATINQPVSFQLKQGS
jgi:cytoskeletal protein RodZ